MIISFAYTTPPLLAGAKTMTWRDWDARYAAMFKPGAEVQAWDRLPRAHGKRIGTIRILSVTRGTLADLTDDDYEAEGMAWLAAHSEAWPKTIWGQRTTAYHFSREAFDQRRLDGDEGYIVRFDWLGVWP